MNSEKVAIGSAVTAAVDRLMAALDELSKEIHGHPELRFAEHYAASLLCEFLERYGFLVSRGVAGMETAFVGTATVGDGRGPRAAVFCEYDALEGLGHACGHNVIAAAGAGAGVAAYEVLRERGLGSGQVVVVGSPGEEGGGGKVRLLEAGVLDNVDVALMIHPAGADEVYRPNLGRLSLEIEFNGRAAHAASAPEEGRNALDAATLFLCGIGLLRQQVRSSSRVHAIVVDGGQAVNVIPEYSRLKVFVRSPDAGYLRGRLLEAVRQCAVGAAIATGTTQEVREVAPAYVPLIANPVLAGLVADGFELVGRNVEACEQGMTGSSAGSTDMGNVSEVVPAIHPYIELAKGVAGHTREFERAAGGPGGSQAVRDGAVVLGQAMVRVIENPKVVVEAREAWRRQKEEMESVRDEQW